MMDKSSLFDLIYVICPSEKIVPDLMRKIEYLLFSGIKWFQYRGKDVSRKEQYEEASRLMDIISRHGARLIINDYPDIAIAVDAHGVHLGQDDIPISHARRIMGNSRIIGISTHNIDEAVTAQELGADYIGFGPIYKTPTKPDAQTPKGPEAIIPLRKVIRIPIVAIGGIRHDNVKPVFESGADMIAVSSGILYGDVRENLERFLMEISMVFQK